MIHTYKLTPEYFIRRALKAKTFSDLVDANVGLYNLYKRHTEYQYQMLMESVFGSRYKSKTKEYS